MSAHEAKVRAWSFGLDVVGEESFRTNVPQDDQAKTRNPDWSREELIFALHFYLQFRKAPPSKKSPEIAELSSFLRRMAQAQDVPVSETFRNANGVYMKMMNFRSIDPDYTGLARSGFHQATT